jgi:hypothetical protein
LTFVGTLHAINTYRDKQRAVEPDMPPGALRRLPGGKLLMVDGSTQKEEEQSEHSHRLHQLKGVGEGELALDRMWRYVKESVWQASWGSTLRSTEQEVPPRARAHAG